MPKNTPIILCIVIDDEPLALRQIVSYIKKTPFLILLDKFENPLPALSFIEKNTVDLIFVDINMPDLNGLDFVKRLENPPKIIFTTAYSQYAVEGFRVDAVDYLLKPIGYCDFLKSVDRAKERLDFEDKRKVGEDIEAKEGFLFIKSNYKIIRINYFDIKYIESIQEYLKIYLENKEPIMTLMSLKKLELHLPSSIFLRVHRSYIVNLNKITEIERNRIVFDHKIYIPIGEQYKARFHEFLIRNSL